ncbi:hypothetical protein ACLOJK_001834 [Asimina triloba]
MYTRSLQITLSGLLNFIDGLWSSCGHERIIVFTTNHMDKLDPALLRPGRMDMHIHMSYYTFFGFKTLAKNYHTIQEDHDHPSFEEIKQLMMEVEVTPAQVAEELMKSDDPNTAFGGFVKFLKRKKVEDEEEEAKSNEEVVNGEKPQVENALVYPFQGAPNFVHRWSTPSGAPSSSPKGRRLHWSVMSADAAGGKRRRTGVDGQRTGVDGQRTASSGQRLRATDLDRRWADLIRRSGGDGLWSTALLTARALAGRKMGAADDPGNDQTNADVGESGLQMGFWIQRLLADMACLLDFPTARGGRTLDAAAWIVDVVGRTDRGADGFRVAVEPRADAAGRDSDDGSVRCWCSKTDGQTSWLTLGSSSGLAGDGRKRRAYLDLSRRFAALGFAGSQDDYG